MARRQSSRKAGGSRVPDEHAPSGRIAGLLLSLPEGIVLTLLAALPSYFSLASSRIFEEEKVLLLTGGALIVACLAPLRWRGERELWQQPAAIAFGALLATLAVATLLGRAPFEALFGAYNRRHGLVAWLALGVLFVEASRLARSPSARDRLLLASVLGSVWPSVYALLQFAGADPVTWDGSVTRAASTLGNPLLFAGYLAPLLFLTTVIARRFPIAVVCLPLQVAALLASGSRGPALAAIGGALLFLAIMRWPHRRTLVLTGAAALLAAEVLLLVAPAASPAGIAQRLDPSGSGRVRVLIWRGVRDLAAAHPARLAIGYGPDSLHRVLPPYYDPEIGQIEQTEAMPDRAHNEMLDMLVAAGVPGVLLQALFFAIVVAGTFIIPDPWLRAGLAAAAFTHLLEIQLGIATVSSRLVFLVVAALVVGQRLPHAAAAVAPATVPWISLGAAATAGAAAPLISVAAGVPLPHLLMLGAALLLAWRRRAAERPVHHPAWPVALTTVALVAAFWLCLRPARADAMARIGELHERQGDAASAHAAYDAASRLAPSEGTYLTSLARTAMVDAARREGAEAAARYDDARTALMRARALNPDDPYPPRSLASLGRVQARQMPAAEREPLLADADRWYTEAVARAPRLPGLWVEWANVDAERGRFSEARTKLDSAGKLDGRRADVWYLRGLIGGLEGRPTDAVDAFNEALERDPDSVVARRARAATFVQLGRHDEARADAEQLRRRDPADPVASQILAK